MALAGVELETLVSEPDALTTRLPKLTIKSLLNLAYFTLDAIQKLIKSRTEIKLRKNKRKQKDGL